MHYAVLRLQAIRDRCRRFLPERCVVDGEIVVADPDGNGLDFDALSQRIYPAESRVRMRSIRTWPSSSRA